MSHRDWVRQICTKKTRHLTHNVTGAVVTNNGYSDWSTQNVPNTTREYELRVKRTGADYLIEARYSGHEWEQIRICRYDRVNSTIELQPLTYRSPDCTKMTVNKQCKQACTCAVLTKALDSAPLYSSSPWQRSNYYLYRWHGEVN